MRARWIVSCAAAILLSGGCASESNDADRAATNDGAAEEAEADDVAVDREADQAAADAALLTLDDFPSGWQEGPPVPEDDDDEVQADMAECLGIDPDEVDSGNPRATSPPFVSEDEHEVLVGVTMAPSADEVQERLELLASDEAPGCYSDAVQAVVAGNLLTNDLPAGVEVDDPTVNRLSFDRLGDRSVAFRATLPITFHGLDLALYVDLVFVQVGRAGVSMQFQSELSPFDVDEAARLTQIVVDRVEPAAD